MRLIRLTGCCAALALLGACTDGYGLDPLDTRISGKDSGPSGDSDWTPGGKDSGESQDTGPVNPIPQLTGFSIEEVEDRVRFTFQVKDEDGDLRNGLAVVDVGGLNTVSYTIPDQVVSQGEDTYYVAWKQDVFTPEQQYNCSVWVTDSAGNSSNTLSDTYARSAWSAEVDEKGDTFSDVSGVGLVQTPGVINGDLYATGSNSSGYTGDIDFIKFRVEESRSYRITLTWEKTAADYDLFLMGAGAQELAKSATYNFPERITYSLSASTDYFLAVAGYTGAAGTWTLRIE